MALVDPSPSAAGPYDIVFAVLLAVVAVCSSSKLAVVARLLILIFPVVAIGFSIYYLIRRDTWNTDELATDQDRYRRAMSRSTTIYLLMTVILFVVTRAIKGSQDTAWYNFVSLFVTTLIAYIYDRCVSTDEGLALLKQDPGRAILDSFLSLASPSFMRFILVLVTEVSLSLLIARNIGNLIPSQCSLTRMLFNKIIVPILVFSIVTGPLRFDWAYPNVSDGFRVQYLTAYIIVFAILALIVGLSGGMSHQFGMESAGGLLILIILIATILQTGGYSNAPHEPHVETDATALPLWVMSILAPVILISVIIIGWKLFSRWVWPLYMSNNADSNEKHVRRVHYVNSTTSS